MKSRRVLQVFVGVLSIILLVCLALVAAVIYLHSYLTFIPKQIADIGDTFQTGLNAVFKVINLQGGAVPAVFFGAPSLLLLLAIILILTKNKGKDGKNIAGCIFALLGVAALTIFMLLFEKVLFATSIQLIACSVIAGVLALFLLFIGLALGIKPKKQPAPEVAASDEPSAEVAASTTETEPVVVVDETPETEETPEEPTAESTPLVEEEPEADTTPEVEEEPEVKADEPEATPEEVEEVKTKVVIEEKVNEAKADDTPEDDDTPATQYVPHESVTIREVVDKTYGKEDDSLSSSTLQKLSKVRALYEAKVITEQEYIKLIHKYLGF